MSGLRSGAPQSEPITVGDLVTISGDEPGVFYRVVGFTDSRFRQALCQSVKHPAWTTLGIPTRDLHRVAPPAGSSDSSDSSDTPGRAS